jgi:hypothetical protein
MQQNVIISRLEDQRSVICYRSGFTGVTYLNGVLFDPNRRERVQAKWDKRCLERSIKKEDLKSKGCRL